jgi:hypothetical protein
MLLAIPHPLMLPDGERTTLVGWSAAPGAGRQSW